MSSRFRILVSALSVAGMVMVATAAGPVSAKTIRGCAIKPNTSCVQVNLKGANLVKANLRGADLKGANLEDANLRGANLNGADLKQTKLGYANDSNVADWTNAVCPDGVIAAGSPLTCVGH